MNVRCIKQISLILIMAVLISTFSLIPVSAYSEDNFLLSGETYYIKNVRSGKYLDVEKAQTANETNIIQWQYTGGTNQQWKITYIGGGLYKIASALDLNKVISIEDATGQNGKNAYISTYNGSVKQHFAIVRKDNTTRKILSNASNYIRGLTVENASCNNGANVFQYNYNATGNDEWLIEPATYYNSTYGIAYARANHNNYLMTYPNLSGMGGDCANFVSQCLAAGGKHYIDDWYINKSNHTNLSPTNSTELDYTWQLADPSPWISAVEFNDFWSKDQNIHTMTYSLDEIINNTSYSSVNFTYGDVVQILKVKPSGLYTGYHTMYITDLEDFNNKGTYKLTYHSSNTKDESLLDICKRYKNKPENFVIRFFDFT